MDNSVQKAERDTFSDCEDSGQSLLWADDSHPSSKSKFKTRSSNRISSLRIQILVTTFNTILFTISVLLFWRSLRADKLTLQEHWKATSLYSPVFDRFKIPKINRVTNGTLFDTNPPSIWRARTGPDADSAWDRVGSNVPPIVITADQVRAIGKDPETAVRFPKEYGYGEDAYMASIEVFHHIHCLDKLRREISYEHYWEKEEGPRPGSLLHQAHTTHCIDVLIQSLMCTGSVDMITYNWVEGRSMMMADFNNNKVCRNFDTLLDWVSENGVPMNETSLRATKPPPGALRVPNEFHDAHMRQK